MSVTDSAYSTVSGEDRIIVFIPMYNCEAQIPRVLNQFEDPGVADVIDAIVCVDNQSTDSTLAAAKAALETLPVRQRFLLRNDDNYGLGGSHKVAISFAQSHGFDYLVVLHGDDQGSIQDAIPLLKAGAHRDVDFLMGARFMPQSKLVGYSWIRTSANIVFNWIFSIISAQRLYDLGSGLNIFRVRAFDDSFHMKFADDLTFNYYLILAIAALKRRVRFFPLTWREDDQISNAKLSRMGFQILNLLRTRVLNKDAFLNGEHRAIPRAAYPSTERGRWPAH